MVRKHHECYGTLYVIKGKKYKGILNIYTSVVFDIQRKEIRVCNDAGRLIRPLLRVKDNKIHVTKFIMDGLMDKTICWDDLLTNMTLEQSVIEYIDPAEQNASLIAMKPKQLLQDDDYKVYNYTHCEIHPSTIFWHPCFFVFHFLNIINPRVTRINVLWVNKPWASMLRIMINVWIKPPMYYPIQCDHL